MSIKLELNSVRSQALQRLLMLFKPVMGLPTAYLSSYQPLASLPVAICPRANIVLGVQTLGFQTQLGLLWVLTSMVFLKLMGMLNVSFLAHVDYLTV